jgi:hypothetical protein
MPGDTPQYGATPTLSFHATDLEGDFGDSFGNPILTSKGARSTKESNYNSTSSLTNQVNLEHKIQEEEKTKSPLNSSSFSIQMFKGIQPISTID